MTNKTKQHDPKGIWIPRAIWIAPGLSLREKALLALIVSSDPHQGYRASTKHLIDALAVKERHVQTCVSAIRDKGYVTVRVEPNFDRVIRPTAKLTRLIKQTA